MKHSLSILLALAAALTVSLSGCSGSSTSADASFSDSDLILNIGGDSYTCAVGIDTVTGFFTVEGSTLLWDELCAARGLDEKDVQNAVSVAQYVAARERLGRPIR